MAVYKNGFRLTRISMNGVEISNGYMNGVEIFPGSGAAADYTFNQAGVIFEVSREGLVTLTIADEEASLNSATYNDGDMLGTATNDRAWNNTIVINSPPNYNNPTVTETLRRIQPGADQADVNMVSITEGTLFANSYRVLLTGEIIDDGGSDVGDAGFYVYKGDTDNPSVVEANGEEVKQSGVEGVFNQTYSTTESNTLFSVVAYATNGLGTALSSNVLQYTSDVILKEYTQTTWTASGGYVTIASDGDVTVFLGSAQSYTGFGNTGTHDTCGEETVSTSGTVKSPITGYSNNDTDIPISTSASRKSTKETYSFDEYNGTVEVSQGGTPSVPTANAKRITNVSQSPTGPNTGAESRDVTVSFTVTASSVFCNEDSTFSGSKTVQQDGLPPTPTTLDISPNALAFSSAAQTADPKPSWTQSGGTSGVGITLTSTLPSWITSAASEPSTQEITITVLKNETSSSRSNTISWQTLDGFASDSITVTQNAPTNNDATTGSINGGNDITVTSATTSVDLLIAADGDWTLRLMNDRGATIPGWTLSRSSGSSGSTIIFNGTTNTSTTRERAGEIILDSTSGSELNRINFTQLEVGGNTN